MYITDPIAFALAVLSVLLNLVLVIFNVRQWRRDKARWAEKQPIDKAQPAAKQYSLMSMVPFEVRRQARAAGMTGPPIPNCNRGNKCPWGPYDPQLGRETCRACGLLSQGSGQ